MKLGIIVSVLALAICYTNAQASECTTPDGGMGLCRKIPECKHLLRLLYAYKFGRMSDEIKTLFKDDLSRRQDACKREENMFCCDGDCITPSGISGIRKDIWQCPPLVELLGERNTIGMLYVRKSRFNQSMEICCGPSPLRAGPPRLAPTEDQCDRLFASPQEPGSGCCGVDASTAGATNGSSAGILEFPWTVILEYQLRVSMVANCGGSLITNVHVVTAAHCVINAKIGAPKHVRIGDYDKDHPGRDCVYQADGTTACTDGDLTVSVAAYLAHPGYSRQTAHNDIALLWLADPVRYTAFVRPICLPTKDFAKSNVNDQLAFIVAGWGKRKAGLSTVKQSIELKLVNLRICQDAYKYRVWDANYVLWEKQMCAGGELGQDTCKGDSGGGLMSAVASGPHYELAGVVSFGLKRCGTAGLPGVYTNVYQYKEWIENSVKTVHNWTAKW